MLKILICAVVIGAFPVDSEHSRLKSIDQQYFTALNISGFYLYILLLVLSCEQSHRSNYFSFFLISSWKLSHLFQPRAWTQFHCFNHIYR